MSADLLTLADLAADFDSAAEHHTQRALGHTDPMDTDLDNGVAAGYRIAADICATLAVNADHDGVVDHRIPLDDAAAALAGLVAQVDEGDALPALLTGGVNHRAAAVTAIRKALDAVQRATGMYPNTLDELVQALGRHHDAERDALDSDHPGTPTESTRQYRTGARQAFDAARAAAVQALGRVGDGPGGVGEHQAALSLMATLDRILEDRTWDGRAGAEIPAAERKGWRDAFQVARAMAAEVAARLGGAPGREPGDDEDRPVAAGPGRSVWSGYPKVLRRDDMVTDMRELALFLGGDVDSFTGDLLRLIAKADPHNLNRIGEGFPEHVAAFLMWRAVAPVPAGKLADILDITYRINRR